MGGIIDMKLKIKKQSQEEIDMLGLQSCRWCPVGIGAYKVESDEGTYYVCEKHRKEHRLPTVNVEA